MTKAQRLAAALFCLLTAGSALTACGDDDDQAAVCDDVDALQTSVDTLQEAEIGEDGVAVLSTELPKVQTQLQELGESATAQYAPQVDAVKAEANMLESSIAAAAAAPSEASLRTVGVAVESVASAVSDLGDAVSDTC